MGILIIIILSILITIYFRIGKVKISKKLISIIYIVICILLFFSFFVFLIYSKNFYSPNNIKEVKYIKASNNLYYDEEKKIHIEQNMHKLMLLSEYLDEKYPDLTFYIKYINEIGDNNDIIRFTIFQIIDMAIADDTVFYLNLENGNVKKDYFDEDVEFNFKYNQHANINVSIDDIKKEAMNLAKKHKKQMFSYNAHLQKIEGYCYLEYNEKEKFYYKVVLNKSSYVKIDVINGNIIDYNFWNGIID